MFSLRAPRRLFSAYKSTPERPVVFFDVSQGTKPLGRITMEASPGAQSARNRALLLCPPFVSSRLVSSLVSSFRRFVSRFFHFVSFRFVSFRLRFVSFACGLAF